MIYARKALRNTSKKKRNGSKTNLSNESDRKIKLLEKKIADLEMQLSNFGECKKNFDKRITNLEECECKKKLPTAKEEPKEKEKPKKPIKEISKMQFPKQDYWCSDPTRY